MTVRLGAVEYLNARPLVYGLSGDRRFDVRFDIPARCAELLHTGHIDLGLIPSIEFQNGDYRIVPDLAIASRGPVASVAIYATRPMTDVRSIALDTSSRTSVALVRVLCARVFRIAPSLERRGPDLADMLAHADAALIIGDTALVADAGLLAVDGRQVSVEKIDLGDVWRAHTGLPFVYAFWAGRAGAIDREGVRALQMARDRGIAAHEAIAREYFRDAPQHQALGARYLRDNIKYSLGRDEKAGLERFYAYAAEAGVVGHVRRPCFYDEP
jgi:chorismate dehydratase